MRPFPKQGGMSENKRPPLETVMGNGIFITDQHHWSVSQSNAISERQRLAATAGIWFYLCVPACMRGCRNHMSWHPCPISPFLCQSHSVTFFLSLSSCFTVCMSGIQNGIHLSVFTAHVQAPSWHSIRLRRWSGLHFSAGRQTGFGLFVNNMKWNQIPGTPVSENWKRSGVCKNKPGLYTPILPIEERIHSQSHSIPVE